MVRVRRWMVLRGQGMGLSGSSQRLNDQRMNEDEWGPWGCVDEGLSHDRWPSVVSDICRALVGRVIGGGA